MANKNAWLSALVPLLFVIDSSIAEVVVTGSPLKRTAFNSPLPVTQIDIEEITGLRGAESAGGASVLVNGQQLSAFVETDVGLIPAEFVNRIELVKPNAASSSYGAEATASVINVVTTPEYNGFNVTGPWILPYIQRGAGDIWFSFQSNEYCDTTNGVLTKPFALFDSWNYGQAEYSKSGNSTFYGTVHDGFKPFDSSQNRTAPGAADNGASTGGSTVNLDDLAPPADQMDGATPAPDNVVKAPDPFAVNEYPADYYFDFSVCDDKQKKELLDLIASRDDARGAIVQSMARSRNPYRSAEQVSNDDRSLATGKADRDRLNDDLRAKWLECVTPEMSAAADTATATKNETGDAACASLRPSHLQTLVDLMGKVNVEVHVEEETLNAEDESRWHAVPGFGVGLQYYNYGDRFGAPGENGALRCPDLGAGTGSNRMLTNHDGIAAFEIPAGRLGAAVGYEHRMSMDDTFAPDSAPAQDTPVNGVPSIPVTSSLKRDADELGVDWHYGVNYGATDALTVGIRYKAIKTDRVVQKFAGVGGPGVNFLPDNIWNQLPTEYQRSADKGSSIGNDWYQPYSYYEYEPLDLGVMNTFPKQGGWSNDQCGDTALPPEGVGYLPANESPVKSVDDQWALGSVGAANDASLLAADAEPVIVGIIDTGLDWNHLDFAWDNLWRNADEIPGNSIDDDNNGYVDDMIGWDFLADNNRPWDNDGHGTFVAGIIAATQSNDAGIDGINPNARIMVLKAVNNFGQTRASLVARAIVYGADNGAKILNLSVSGPGFPPVVQDAVDYAESKGVLVIMAAGNRAEDIDNASPGRLKRVMAVAATGPDNNRAAFSNVGSAINIAAPGIDIVSLRARATDFMHNSAESSYVPGDAFLGDDRRYYRSTGTSFAAPIVAGVASLVWSNRPELTHRQVRRILEQSARDVEMPGRDLFTGYGIVDAKAALAADPEFYIHAVMPTLRPIRQDDELFLHAVGIADADRFARASLEIGQGEDPQAWTNLLKIVEPIRFGELGRIPVTHLEGSTVWTVRLVVEHQNGRKREARYVVDML